MTLTKHSYGELLLIDTLQNKGIDESLDIIALLIDYAPQFQSMDGLEKAFHLLREAHGKDLSPPQKSLLHYFHANAWANHLTLRLKDEDDQWTWEQEEYEQQIIHLRLALAFEGFIQIASDRQCQILTNLANIFDHVGRSVEAIWYWDRALKKIPNFEMALGNKGIGLYHSAYSHYHRHDNIRLIGQSHQLLRQALETTSLDESARDRFAYYFNTVSAWKAHEDAISHHIEDLSYMGETTEEIEYRKWCLIQRLILNILNDIEETPNAAVDKLVLPSIITNSTDTGFHRHGMFNQLKQEYVAARFFYYEAITSEGVHFADRKVKLYNTLDYPSYSLAIEKTKVAFRMAYSLFDKIAYFLNSYLRLEIPEISVSFRTCWYKQQNRKKGLRSEFVARKNWPLRGLFWLSKDLFEDRPNFKEALEPSARELNSIRNHLEHKYLKVHEFGVPPSDGQSAFQDDLAFSVGRGELKSKTLLILKLARSALVYLCMAVQWEERHQHGRNENQNEPRHFTIQIEDYDDDWKL